MIAVAVVAHITPLLLLILINVALLALLVWRCAVNAQKIPVMVRRLEENVELLEEGKALLERLEEDLKMISTERDAYAKLIAQSNVHVELKWTTTDTKQRRLDVYVSPKEAPPTEMVH